MDEKIEMVGIKSEMWQIITQYGNGKHHNVSRDSGGRSDCGWLREIVAENQ
tara:strand:- start:990 stop:1142 length:153 start_codon:yes stop_codon:yes gene_type:complete